jgi:hypothetical protein
MEYIAVATNQGYILTNEKEKYLIHKSIKIGKDNKENKKFAPYCLRNLDTNKHITGMFQTLAETPTFTYYTESERVDITIRMDKAYKTIKPKIKSKIIK